MKRSPSPLLLLLLLLLATEVCVCGDVGSMMVGEDSNVTISRGQILSAQFECYLKILHDPPRSEAGSYCNRTWDGWMCWADSTPGTAMQNCPTYYQDFDPSEKVTKVCNSDGQWFRHPESNRIWSNYTECSAHTKAKLKFAFMLYYLAIVGHGLSIVSLLISLCIFSYFKSLSCQRISLHKNMFLSFILNSTFTVIWLTAVANNHSQRWASNPMGCKFLSALTLYTFGSNYFWMLCEGIYLHTLIIVAVFVGEQQLCWYYVLGWAFPIIPAVTHALARWLFYNDRCWISSDTHLLYIIHGPIQAALLVNLFFLLNIVRVLITKLKVTHIAESNTYMKAVRATLILVPLLGAQFILVPWRPEGRVARAVYELIMNVLMHFQGLLVAIIFCFCNGEVQYALRRKWAQYRTQCWGYRGRLVTTDSHSTYHTNSSVTETSRVTVSLEPTAEDNKMATKKQSNGQSNGKRCSNGEGDTPPTMDMTEI